MTASISSVLILGAASDIAMAIARRYAKAGRELILAARNAARLDIDAKDLHYRTGAIVRLAEFDVLDLTGHIAFLDSLGLLPDIAICAVGLLGDQGVSEVDALSAERVMRTNYLGPAIILGELANRMQRRGSGLIVGISSVAGDRGRSSNYVYGSAKAGFTAFLSGLRARSSGRGVRVITVKPGFVQTRMTAGMALPAMMTAQPEEVAAAMLVFDPLVASFVAGSMAVLLYGLGLSRLAFLNGGSSILAAVIAALGAFTGYAVLQLLNGLETGLAMAAVTWTLVFASEAKQGVAVPLCCGLLPFIRPELAALAAPLLLRQCWLRWQNGSRRTAAMLILSDLGCAAIAAAPWLAWEWVSLGTVFPPTAVAKEAFFAEQGLPALDKAQMVAHGFAQSGITPLIPALLLARRDQVIFCLWAFVLAVIVALYHSLPGGAGQSFSRYDFILLPPLIYGLVSSLRYRPRLLALAILAFSALMSWAGLPSSAVDFTERTEFMRTEPSDLAQWARDNLPPTAKILVHDAGYFAFATPFRLIDVVGLKTPESVAYHRQWTATSMGRDRPLAVDAIARRFAPSFAIILHDRWRYWQELESDLTREGWSLTAVRIPPRPEGYFVFKLLPP
jgi:short-subunit dehydrogenase